jgi:predicted glycosyltransferase
MAKKYQILFSHDIVITYKSFMFVTLILHLYGTHVVMMENHARGHLKKTHVFFAVVVSLLMWVLHECAIYFAKWLFYSVL